MPNLRVFDSRHNGEGDALFEHLPKTITKIHLGGDDFGGFLSCAGYRSIFDPRESSHLSKLKVLDVDGVIGGGYARRGQSVLGADGTITLRADDKGEPIFEPLERWSKSDFERDFSAAKLEEIYHLAQAQGCHLDDGWIETNEIETAYLIELDTLKRLKKQYALRKMGRWTKWVPPPKWGLVVDSKTN